MSARLQAAVTSLPILTRGLIGVLAVGYALQLAVPASRNYLGLVVGHSLTNPWTFITSGLLADSLVEALASIAVAAVLGGAVEAHLGATETLKTLACALPGASLTALISVTAAYAVAVASNAEAAVGAGVVLYEPILGFHGATAALLVALKLVVPENEVTLFSHFSFRIKNLPGIFILAATVFGVVEGHLLHTLPFVVGGAFSAWLYLRFAQPQPGGGRGTAGDDFSFASFFPGSAGPLANSLATQVSRVTGLSPTPSGATHGLAHSLGLGGAVLPGTGTADAARRRERGQRALEERLGLAEEAAAPRSLPQRASSKNLATQASGTEPGPAGAGKEVDPSPA